LKIIFLNHKTPSKNMEGLSSYLLQGAVGAVIGFVGNYIPLVKNNQSTITNVVLGLVGSVGGSAAAGAAGIDLGGGTMGQFGTSLVGSVVGLLAGKLMPKKA
jgi:uncharacterized membrane protein YeaQ/YmgE (transglycosylase-associated protein family)